MSGKYPTVVKGECAMATYDSVNDKRKKNWAVNALRYNVDRKSLTNTSLLFFIIFILHPLVYLCFIQM